MRLGTDQKSDLQSDPQKARSGLATKQMYMPKLYKINNKFKQLKNSFRRKNFSNPAEILIFVLIKMASTPGIENFISPIL